MGNMKKMGMMGISRVDEIVMYDDVGPRGTECGGPSAHFNILSRHVSEREGF